MSSENETVRPVEDEPVAPTMGDVVTILERISQQLADIGSNTPVGRWLNDDQLARLLGITKKGLIALKTARKGVIPWYKPISPNSNTTLWDVEEVEAAIRSTRVEPRDLPFELRRVGSVSRLSRGKRAA